MEEEARALKRNGRRGPSFRRHAPDLPASDWFGARALTPVVAEFATDAAPHRGRDHHQRSALQLLRREADMVFKTRPFEKPEAVSRRLMHMPYAEYQNRVRSTPVPATGPGRRWSPWISPMTDRRCRMAQAHAAAGRTSSHGATTAMSRAGCAPWAPVRPCCRNGWADLLAGRRTVDSEQPPGRDTWVGYHQDMGLRASARAPRSGDRTAGKVSP